MTDDAVLQEFLSIENFELAWERVLHTTHGDAKDQLGLQSFAVDVPINLAILIEQLREREYKPLAAPKIYLPRSSHTLRTLPVLCITDRIVYQALSNIIADRCAGDLSIFANRHVFAHLPTEGKNPYALRKWRGQYHRFLRAFKEHWTRGNKWVAEADIAAYYDSIDHDLLLRLLKKKGWLPHDDILELLRQCLRVWSSHGHLERSSRDSMLRISEEQSSEEGLTRGLPQGYEASDFLATIFLYDVDRTLISKGFKYIRYVDDIRILASTQDKAKRGLIELDLALKSVALILQTQKTSLRCIQDIWDEDVKWTELSLLDQQPDDMFPAVQDNLRKKFFDAKAKLNVEELAERHLIFALNRLEKYDDVRDAVLSLLETLPWRSGDLTRYLHKFKGDIRTANTLRSFIERHKLYSWHLSNCLSCLANISSDDLYSDICQDWVQQDNVPWYQRLAAVDALGTSALNYTFLYVTLSKETDTMIRRSLWVYCFHLAQSNEDKTHLLRMAFTDRSKELYQIALYHLLITPTLNWDELGLDIEALGRLKRLLPSVGKGTPEKDTYIAQTLARNFDVDMPQQLDLRAVFGPIYPYAVNHLRTAMASYSTSPSRYITRLDNFNQVITDVVYCKLLNNPQYDKNNFHANLQAKAFQARCPKMSLHFTECHKLRSITPEVHAYARSIGAWSEDIRYSQAKRITNGLKPAYQEFVDLMLAHAQSQNKKD